MKGVSLGIARETWLGGVSRGGAAHDVTEAALAWEAAAPFFPAGTVHLAVVDPGVGTARRGLAIVTDGARFVGPDNGLFTPFLDCRDWRDLHVPMPGNPPVAPQRALHAPDPFAAPAPALRDAPA